MTYLLWRHPFAEQSVCVLLSPPVSVINSIAVLAHIQETNFETWDNCGWFCALNLVKYQCVWPHESNCGSPGNSMPARSFLVKNAFSSSSILRIPNVYCWSHKTLHHIYNGRISEWISFKLSPFAQNIRITACCSLWDDFNGNVTIFNVYKCHNDVVTIKHSRYLELNSPHNVYFAFFYILKTNRMLLFSNLYI